MISESAQSQGNFVSFLWVPSGLAVSKPHLLARCTCLHVCPSVQLWGVYGPFLTIALPPGMFFGGSSRSCGLTGSLPHSSATPT